MLATPSNDLPRTCLGEPELLYSAFGLRVRSAIPLPEFEVIAAHSSSGDRCDVSVTVRDETPPPTDRKHQSSWSVTTKEASFWYPGVGRFRVIRGSAIIISPEPFVDEDLLRMYVEGMMFATLLYQRNCFVLHASAIRIGDSSIAVLGAAGSGKSSTAAALYARGHAVVSDDNAAISLSGEAPMITPAFPFLKVFPAIAISLGHRPDTLRRMHSSQPKFVSDVPEAFPRCPVPLAGIYLLSRDAIAPITPLNAMETTIELVRNSVPTRWNLQGTADHLRQCTALARRIPAFCVRTFATLEELPVLAETIERHHLGAVRD